MTIEKHNYGTAILSAFEYLLENYPEVFVIGQGLWSPWYVGSTMKDLDKNFGRDRVIDSSVSEFSVTASAVGAAICGYRPVVIHPRMDFMVFAVDPIVNQAAKWRHMFGGQAKAPITVRSIINRGGEQGAQHSQSLHSWFAHIPGLKVVMPYTAKDARNLMISSVLSNDPVVFLDDRWLYEKEEEYTEIEIIDLNDVLPQKLRDGNDITVVGVSYTSLLCEKACEYLENTKGIKSDFFDLRVLNPLKLEEIILSVNKTGRLLVVDGDWSSCGIASEIIASIMEKVNLDALKSSPKRITLPDAPAPTSKTLEQLYYIKEEQIIETIIELVK